LAQKALDLQLFFTAKGVDNVDNNTSKAGKVNPHDQADLFNPGRITEILRGEDPEQVKAALEGMVNMFEPIRASLAEQLGLPKTASMAEISAKMTESGKPGLFAKAWDAWAKDPFMLGKVKEILGKGKEGVEMLRTLCGLGNRKPCISPGAAMCRAVAAAVGASGVTIAGVKLTEALFMSDDAYPTKDVVGDSELADRSKAGSPAEQTHGATPPVKKGRSQ
jgi:hypothetical protein